MAKYTTENIHTVALVGPRRGELKTTAGRSPAVESRSDRRDGQHGEGIHRRRLRSLEKTYGHSAQLRARQLPYKGIHVHLVDTPGMPDFAGQSIAGARRRSKPR